MNIIYLTISVSLILLLVIGAVLFWAIKNGQYDDMDRYGRDILMDDDSDNESTD